MGGKWAGIAERAFLGGQAGGLERVELKRRRDSAQRNIMRKSTPPANTPAILPWILRIGNRT